MTDYRDKFVKENIEKAKSKSLTEWEKNFVASMEGKVRLSRTISQKEFNKLQEIAQH